MYPKSQAPLEEIHMAFVPTSANAPLKQDAKMFTGTQHAVSYGSQGAIEQLSISFAATAAEADLSCSGFSASPGKQ